MIHVEIIVGCIAFGALYTLIFERYKGNHFENKKRSEGNLSAKNKLKISIFVVNYITKRE